MNETAADIARAVKSLQDYWSTYGKQEGYHEYRVDTLIDDALYGLGIAIDENQFRGAGGYDKFKSVLRAHLMHALTDRSETEDDLEKIDRFPVGRAFSTLCDGHQVRYGWVTGYGVNPDGELVLRCRWAHRDGEQLIHPSNVHSVLTD